ncbi:hypothetical protein [Streptomyces sp. G-G2]|uniref:hypothetical protein n=1 Tax=Streptomyces sp. G-G2 TaxID=3046201 RepID=UPI0024B9F65D|nr:hypothetical protein [Streptomyces sp. G-G2]MDJ0382350.1 hypothetical protein [Streptomyces sp. G-G2]
MDASGNDRRTPALRTHVRTAVLLCAAAALAAATAPAAAQARRVPERDPVLVVDCFAQAQVRPEEYLLACGDGNNKLVRLHWDSWSTRTATATGTDLANDCVPYCAAGRFHRYPVSVTLSDPQPWSAHPDLQRFTTIRLLYAGTAPSPLPKDVTYKLPG